MTMNKNSKRYKRLFSISYGLLLFACFTLAKGQAKTLDSLSLDQLKKSYFEPLKLTEKLLEVPSIAGYTVSLIGSDNPVVIDLQGNVHKPLVSRKVNLVFKVVRQSDESAGEISVSNIRVAGKYEGGGPLEKPFVIPALREWQGKDGDYQLRNTSRIVVADAGHTKLMELATMLQGELFTLLKLELTIATGKAQAGDIVLIENADLPLGEEGYALDIGETFCIEASKYTGFVFGTRTLLQLLAQQPEKLTIPRGLCRDYPRYAVRGLVLDVGRKFFTMDFLMDYVELLAYYKMSDFHIHLNDNAFHKYFDFDWDKTPSGFRLENERYPDLATKDAFYTKAEFRELQKKAMRYGLKIIPEIDVPAHSLAITKVVPSIASAKYGKDHLDLDNPETFTVVTNIFKEYLDGPDPVFIGDVVHIGTDEYDKSDAEKFRFFTDSLIRLVQSYGKEARAWGALTHAKGETPVTSKDVVLNMWYNGYADPLEMKALGYKQISTPDSWLYIVPAAGYYYDYLNVDRIYNRWEPRNIGNVTFEKGDPTVVGGMFAVWNDIVGNGISERDVHNRVFPALQVLATKMWAAEEDLLSLADFNNKKAEIGEAPGQNSRGLFPKDKPVVVQFGMISSMIDDRGMEEGASLSDVKNTEKLTSMQVNKTELSLADIGNAYTVDFSFTPIDEHAWLSFQSKDATFEVTNSQIKYNRDGYEFSVDCNFPIDQTSRITVVGNQRSTTIYVDGKLWKAFIPEKIVLPYTDKAGKEISYQLMKTLTFPLTELLVRQMSYVGVWVVTRELSAEEVWGLYNRGE